MDVDSGRNVLLAIDRGKPRFGLQQFLDPTISLCSRTSFHIVRPRRSDDPERMSMALEYDGGDRVNFGKWEETEQLVFLARLVVR